MRVLAERASWEIAGICIFFFLINFFNALFGGIGLID